MNSLYGEFLGKDLLESYQCKSEMWMQTEYDIIKKLIMEITSLN